MHSLFAKRDEAADQLDLPRSGCLIVWEFASKDLLECDLMNGSGVVGVCDAADEAVRDGAAFDVEAR